MWESIRRAIVEFWPLVGGIALLIDLIKNLLTDRPMVPAAAAFFRTHPRVQAFARALIGVMAGFLIGIFVAGTSVGGDLARSAKPKTRIVLLLPTGDGLRYQDGKRQLNGLSQFIIDTDGRYMDDFEFVPVNSAMSASVARDIVEHELSKGTKYFISTMSRVNETLSMDFEKLVREKAPPSGPRPVLLCTVASSSKILVKPNSVYRFYPRAHEEAELLANVARDAKVMSVGLVAVDDAYGRSFATEFSERLKDSVLREPVYVALAASEDEIRLSLLKTLFTPGRRQVEAVVVAHYGDGISSVVKALDRLGSRSMLLMTGPMSIRDWQLTVLRPLLRLKWFVSVPDYERTVTTKDDVIQDFTAYSIQRLVQTVNFMNNDSSLSFDDSWRKTVVEIGLRVSWDSSGDSIVPLKAVDRSHFRLFDEQ